VVKGILRGFNNIFQYCLAGFIIGNELRISLWRDHWSSTSMLKNLFSRFLRLHGAKRISSTIAMQQCASHFNERLNAQPANEKMY